jgi:hypothetical protein
VGEDAPPADLSKADASRRIDELQARQEATDEHRS